MTGESSTLKRTIAVGRAVALVAGFGAGTVASLTEGNAPSNSVASEGNVAAEANAVSEANAAVQDPENALVRVAHMSEDAPAVDVLVDDETVAQNVGFGDVTEYLDLQEGEHGVTVVTAANRTTVLETQVSAEPNERYTLMAVGQVGENATEEFRLVTLQDADNAPSGNDASVRLVHVAPDTGPVDVTVNRTGEVLFDNVTFGNTTEYVTMPSGVYTLNVREATADDDGTIVATFTESFVNRTAYSTFAAVEGDQHDEPLALFVAIDQTDNPDIPGVTTTAEAANQTTTAVDEETTVADGEETTVADDEETTTAMAEATTTEV